MTRDLETSLHLAKQIHFLRKFHGKTLQNTKDSTVLCAATLFASNVLYMIIAQINIKATPRIRNNFETPILHH